MIRSDRTTSAPGSLFARARKGPALRRRGVGFAPALVFVLLAACGGEDPVAPTKQNDDAVEADEGDEGDESTVRRDSGARDAGRKDAGSGDDEPSTPVSPRDAGAAKADAGKPAQGARDAGPPATPDAGPVTVTPPGDGNICARWKADRANLSEGVWNGNVEACNAGEMTPEAIANALRLFNMYRFMAGLAPVTNSPEGNRLAQGCALLMKANGTITHTPPTTWKCYNAEAAKTAGGSSVSSGPAVGSVEGYMIDPGNPTTIGHRRWILSNMLTEVGFGSADRFSCQYQPAKRPSGGKPWVAWPPAGQVPAQSLGGRFTGTIDQTGWTVQSDSINLANAQVTVTSGGEARPVTVTQLLPGYGSSYALRFNPMGWTATAGQTYSVKLSGTAMPIEYEVQVVDCP